MDTSKYLGKYFGQRKIKSVSLSDRKTFKKGNVLKLVYDDEQETSEEIPQETIDIAMRNNTMDATSLRDIIIVPVIKEILEVLLDKEVKVEAIDYIFAKTKQSIGESINRTIDKVLGKSSYDLTFADLDRILTQNQQKKHEPKRRTKTKNSD